MNNNFFNVFLRLILVTSLFTFLAADAKNQLSTKEEKKLNELIEISKPIIPIFGKISEPLKTGISIYQSPPTTIDINTTERQENIIKLKPQDTGSKNNELSKLEEERKDLQKAEIEGLSFIQPSLELSQEEQRAIDEFFSRNEQEQLLNLWKVTIERNKTIQFIVQKLTPLESPQAANSLLSKTLGAAIFLPFYALQAFADNAGAYYGSQVGGRVLGSVVEGKMKKNQTEIQLSQTEAIILFMMIDEVAERLRQRYHAYKRLMVERILANNELEESKKDTLEAHESDSKSAEVLAGIQRRSIEREVRKIDAQLRSHKNALVELAGPVAVNDLDNQLRLELAAAGNTPLDFVGVEER